MKLNHTESIHGPKHQMVDFSGSSLVSLGRLQYLKLGHQCHPHLYNSLFTHQIIKCQSEPLFCPFVFSLFLCCHGNQCFYDKRKPQSGKPSLGETHLSGGNSNMRCCKGMGKHHLGKTNAQGKPKQVPLLEYNSWSVPCAFHAEILMKATIN